MPAAATRPAHLTLAQPTKPGPHAAPGKVLLADLFCGAGGTTSGAEDACRDLGLEPVITCVNHWKIAIDTHRRNHPNAIHYCQDIATVRPHLAVPGGRLDLLMASPTCTFHSRARGGKPTSDQQRMDPWHVVAWLTELDVRSFLIENVPEFVFWGPVDPLTGKPIKALKGTYFQRWIFTIRGLGYKQLQWRILNCADYGDATTRQRFFLIGRKDGKPITWPKPTHAPAHKAVKLGLPPWRPARNIIDWSVKGQSIFDRKRPLSPKTLARIYAGAAKFHWPEPFLVILRNHMAAQSVDLPLPTITAGGTHIGLVQPFLFANRNSNAPKDPDCAPVPCLTTAHGGGIAIAEPFILSRHAEGAPRAIDEPTPCQVAKHSHILIEPASPLIAPYYGSGSGKSCNDVDHPLPTVTTKQRFGLITPVTHTDRSNRTRSVDEPLPTITTARRGELAFIAAAFGERPTQSPRVHSIDEPAPTVCATGRINLVEATHPVPGTKYPGTNRDYDILFRMLTPDELARAMSFREEDREYEFTGTKEQVVKQIGNAVPRRTATALVHAILEA